MKLVGVGEAQAGLSSLLDQSQKERIILTRHGKPVAMLTGVEGRDLEELMLSQDPAFRALINERRREQGPGVSHATLMAEAKREIAASQRGKARGRVRKK